VDAPTRIWMLDSAGIVGEGRGNISPEKAPFAQSTSALRAAGTSAGASLIEAVRSARPTCLIGAAGKAGLFTPDVLSSMSTGMRQWAGGERQRPVVLALSNPTSRSECTFQEAWDATAGRVVFASGSPFPAVETGEGRVHASQANNALVFPGIAAGSVLMGVETIPESSFLAAAHALADAVTDGECSRGLVVPPIARIRDAAMAVTMAVCLQSSAEVVALNTGNKKVLRAVEAVAEAGVLDGVQRSIKLAQLQDVIEDWRF
jgi:malate dehydrogenase (oxaloacetate-decarboxylating)(NADP+)